MQKKLLTKLIKSKIQKSKSIDELIDEFIKKQSTLAKGQLEEFMSDLLIYINKNYDSLASDTLLAIVASKLTDLNISFDTKELDDIYKKLSIINSPSTKFIFNKTDLAAIESMRKNFYWVGTEYSDKTQTKVKDTIEKAFKGEITRAEISSTLKEQFETILKGDERYFEGVADHIINQSQNISKVNQALKYDVKHFQVKARIDKKTSDICRSMHGKIIEAAHLDNQVSKVLAAKNISEKKEAAQWKNDAHYGKLPSNFGLPPYHFRCRTEIVPVWLSTEEIDGKKVKYALKKKDDIITHIDNTGVQRRVSKKNWTNHIDISRQGTLKHKDIISSLNSINEIAPHKDNPYRSVAKSANGYFMVFQADELVTIFPPGRKNYFKDYANLDKKEIIKWEKENSLSGFLKTLTGR